MRNLVNKFLSLRCAGDVLESVQPISGDFTRRLTESMAVIEAIKPLIIKEPGKWKIADICAGSPLAGVIAAHLFKVELVTAYDWRPHGGLDSMQRVHSFRYRERINWDEIGAGSTIVVATSPNQQVTAEIARQSKSLSLPMAMIPARIRYATADVVASKLFGVYGAWLLRVAKLADGDFRQLKIDSPNNGLVRRGL